MTLNSTNNSSSIFQDGKLKPGIYKIQNVYTETYADIEMHSRIVCARPAQNLEEGNGLWEIMPLGAGYSIRRVEPGKPEQFCTLMNELKNSPLSVTAYPVAWRLEIVDDVKHRGFEYVRFSWGTTEWAWAVSNWSKENGTKVKSWTEGGRDTLTIIMWKLIPVKHEDTSMPPRPSFETTGQGSPPLYEGDGIGQPSTRTQRTEFEHDDFGTIVTEVTTVTTSTRKRYRVEDT